jgi:hypothetical protein
MAKQVVAAFPEELVLTAAEDTQALVCRNRFLGILHFRVELEIIQDKMR